MSEIKTDIIVIGAGYSGIGANQGFSKGICLHKRLILFKANPKSIKEIGSIFGFVPI